MRIRFALPIIAVFALAACDTSTDAELADAALSADEVGGAAGDADPGFAVPRPGQYRTTQELVDFSMPNLPEDQMAVVRAQFAEGAAEPHSYCVTQQMAREQWLSSLVESDCTVSRSNPGADGIDLVLACTGAEGISGRVALTGTATSEGSDMEMSFTKAIPSAGNSTITMRVKSERTGNCG